MLLFSRQGKLRLQKWYTATAERDKKKMVRELMQIVLARKPKMCSFLEWKDLKIVYKRSVKVDNALDFEFFQFFLCFGVKGCFFPPMLRCWFPHVNSVCSLLDLWQDWLLFLLNISVKRCFSVFQSVNDQFIKLSVGALLSVLTNKLWDSKPGPF